MGTLWYGGTIYTLQKEGHYAEAVLTEGEKVIFAGSLQEIEEKYQEIITNRQDLKGSTMIPGLVDSHMHLIGHGEKLLRLDLSRYRSKKDLIQAVREYAKNIPLGKWIIGEGWNENLWEEPIPPVREELDEAAPNHPLLLKRVCRHAIAVNSIALREASVTEETVCPTGGVIEVDDTGKLNGLLKDQAQDLIFQVMPDESEEHLKQALRAAIKDAHRYGLTGGHTEDLGYYNGFHSTYNIFREIIENEGHRFRAHLLVHYGVMKEFYKNNGSFLKGSQWIEFGAIKIFTDGSLGGRTALLSHPYADDLTTQGVAIFSQEELNNLVAIAREHGMPVAVHSIGDKAFEMALEAIERNPLFGRGRDRIIHAQILRKDLIERAKNLPVVLDIQPSFVSSDFPWVIDRVGKANLKYSYAWKTLLNEKIQCAGGSDAPIEPLNPLHGIYAAVSRKSEGTPYGIQEVLSIYEAVSLYTKGSAYAACHEHNRGTIKGGFLADFTILDRDIFHCPPEELLEIKVDKTVIGGEIVYSSKN